MNTIQDFEDLLELFSRHEVRYLIIGGLAFIYHAKPRYTKDMDLWIDPEPDNIQRANRSLAEFGSPFLLDHTKPHIITQLGLAPNRIDCLLEASPLTFVNAWQTRIEGFYGNSQANWISLDNLLIIKKAIDSPKHREDARVLEKVKQLRNKK
jgi:hypothetical protein